jgi:hypothetical protein
MARASTLETTARSCLERIAGLTTARVAIDLRTLEERGERLKVERDFEKLRRQQTGRGGLLNFVKYFWGVLEPKTRPLIDGWPLEVSWSRLSEQLFRVDKWSVCRG